MILTNWGYTLTTLDNLPDMLTVEEFNNFTARKYMTDTRIEKNIKAAGSAIRNYCGWHVYPGTACKMFSTVQNARVSRVGGDVLIQLPARFVSAVESVKIGGTAREFTFETNGLLRVYDVPVYDRKTAVEVKYTAGIPANMMDAIKELIAHRFTHALA